VGEDSVRVLLVDDHESWRRFASAVLQQIPRSEVVAEAPDGDLAIQLSEQLQPDLILLDIGLPRISGIEAARHIRGLCPSSRILFLTENRSADVAEEALHTGADGYVIKSDGGSELLPAIKAVLEGKRFVSASLSLPHFATTVSDRATAVAHRHEVEFYPDDSSWIDGYARFIKSALNDGNAVIVVVTESHRASLLSKLEADGVDVPAAIERGSYVPLDAVDAMATLTVNGVPDPHLCETVIGGVIRQAAKGVREEHARVMACGEIAPTMLSKGNNEGAIQLEHLWDKITRGFGVHTHCGYVWNACQSKERTLVFERICSEHTAVHAEKCQGTAFSHALQATSLSPKELSSPNSGS